MREIEFRIRYRDKSWFYGVPITKIKNDTVGFQSFDNSYYDLFADATTLGQYIDQLDANKNKIFEGDIVTINGDFEQVGVIKWDKDTSMFVICVENIIYTFDEFYGYELEVIGNIYDNPELIGDNNG